jgi:flagellar hook-length control protein FliK
LPLKEVANKLKLTSSESKLVSELNIEKLDIKELQKIVKTEIIKNPTNAVLKSLSSKLEKTSSRLIANKSNEKSRETIKVANELAVKPTIKDKVKTGIKNIFGVSNSVKNKIENAKPEYLFTLKTEKIGESFSLENNLVVAKKNPELLGKSIYSSKESAEFANVKIVPIIEEVAIKKEFASSSDNSKKVIARKTALDYRVSSVGENSKTFNFEKNNSFQNEQNLNDKNVVSVGTVVDDVSKKDFEKTIQNQVESANKKMAFHEKESGLEAKSSSNEIKISETSLPKSTFSIHQNRVESFNTIPKVVSRYVDIKNIRDEISNLIQKGEKKKVEFQLTPDNLGKMTIKLEVVNKMISASIKVDSESTQQIVQNSLEGLKTSLNQNGVQYNSVSVSLANSEEKNQRYFKQQKKKQNAHKNILGAEGVEETLLHKNLGYNKYDFIA